MGRQEREEEAKQVTRMEGGTLADKDKRQKSKSVQNSLLTVSANS